MPCQSPVRVAGFGFATVSAVMAEANAELGLHGLTPASSPYRAYQEALKNALGKASSNRTLVEPTPLRVFPLRRPDPDSLTWSPIDHKNPG